MLEVGIWPGRTTGLNLRKKYLRYKGNTDLYHRDVADKRSYYNVAATGRAAEASSKSTMTEKLFGKYQLNPILGDNAFENTSLPDFVKQQAYAHMSMSVTVGTAGQYRSAISIIGPASEYLKRPINMPFTTSDCMALIVYMANVRKLKASTITIYFSVFRMLHLVKGNYNQ